MSKLLKKALLVGINYTSIPGLTLHGCINDVKNMKQNLITNYGYAESDIIVLSDDQTNPAFKPTAKNIIGYLLALINVSSKCSEIWFHYSGHGSQIKDANRDEASGYDSVIVPVDFQSVGVIVDDLILQIIKNCQCTMYMLFDSCNSGTVCDLQWSFEYANNNVFKKTQNNSIVVNGKQIFSFSGSKDTQTSADVYDPATGQYYGACTNAFLAVLKANNYNASIMKIYSDLCTFLSNRGYSQKPILSSSSSNPTITMKKTIAAKNLLMAESSTVDRAAPSASKGATVISIDHNIAAAKPKPNKHPLSKLIMH